MKILQFVPYFLPYPGGQERYIYNLSKYLVKKSHEVHIITSNFPKSKKFEEIEGITVERYNPLARPLRNPIVPKFLLIPKRFKEFDVIHVHNEHAFSSMIAAYAKKKQNFPLVLTNHGKLIFGNYIADKIERTYMKHVGKRIFEMSDAIVVNSESDKNFVASIAPKAFERVYVLHNAIDPRSLEEKLKKANAMNFDEIKSDFKVLYVGVLVKRKGVEWLIKAMKIIREKTSYDIKCILVGNGPEKRYFENLVRRYDLSDTVIFTGRVSDEKLMWLYNNSDIFVLPSLSEVCTTSILEAMYFGLPVIATDIPGNRDHFKDVAILVPPKDDKSLASSILRLLKNEDLAKQLSKAGRKLVEKKYTWNKVAKEYEKLYTKIID